MLRNAAQGFGMGSLGTAIPGVRELSGTLGGVAAPTAPAPAVAGSSIRSPAGGGVPAITTPGGQGNITVPPMTAPAAPAVAGTGTGGGGFNVGSMLRDVGSFVKENPMLVGGGLQAFSAYQAAQQAEEERERERRRRQAQSSIALPMLMSRLQGAGAR